RPRRLPDPRRAAACSPRKLLRHHAVVRDPAHRRHARGAHPPAGRRPEPPPRTSLPTLALLPFAAAAVLAGVSNRSKAIAAWIAGATALAGLALLLGLAPAVFDGAVPAWSVQWLTGLGMAFGFRLDGLAWMFAVLIL